jgi:hypothetical protein
MFGRSTILTMSVPLVVLSSTVLAQSSIWKKFTSEAGGFSVVMPGIPRERKEQTLALYEVTRDEERVRYAVGYLELAIAPETDPKLIKEVFDGIQKGVENQQGKLLSFKTLKLSGRFPGREMNFSLPGDFRARWRVYIVGNRTYFLNATTTQENMRSRLATSVEVFLKSFQVKVPKIQETPKPSPSATPTPSPSVAPSPMSPSPTPSPSPQPSGTGSPSPTPSAVQRK